MNIKKEELLQKNGLCKCPYCKKEYKSKGINYHIWRSHTEEGMEFTKKQKNIVSSKLLNKVGHPVSLETKQKISESRIKYLKEHPDKVPYLLNHSSNISYPELILKKALENENIKGWSYRYQNGIYQYDFAFSILKIDIEVDGETHNQQKVKDIDKKRDEWSKSKGWTVIRFTANEIRNNLNFVLQSIKNIISTGILNIDIYEYPCIVDYNLLKIKLKKIDENNKKLIIENKKQLVLNSNINFSRFGWVNKTAEILNITPQNVNRWMKRNMLEFYNEKCFKRRK